MAAHNSIAGRDRDRHQVRGLLTRGVFSDSICLPVSGKPLNTVTCAIESLRLQWRDRVGFAPTSLTHPTRAFQRRV
jgi:hypothetical protein